MSPPSPASTRVARISSDNKPGTVSGELWTDLVEHEMEHTPSALYHPMTQDKIERYH